MGAIQTEHPDLIGLSVRDPYPPKRVRLNADDLTEQIWSFSVRAAEPKVFGEAPGIATPHAR
ncbi:MAG TPA: hypothetical protein VE913_10165, partial [Longimicrobium sp.]|nr:hypothetical protein [Longimicrobium sp.]